MHVIRYGWRVSSAKFTKYGVPQWTVPGSSLFILYITDIVKYIDTCKIQLSSEDTLLYFGRDDVN